LQSIVRLKASPPACQSSFFCPRWVSPKSLAAAVRNFCFQYNVPQVNSQLYTLPFPHLAEQNLFPPLLMQGPDADHAFSVLLHFIKSPAIRLCLWTDTDFSPFSPLESRVSGNLVPLVCFQVLVGQGSSHLPPDCPRGGFFLAADRRKTLAISGVECKFEKY